jgi:hypothetical protein
LTLNILIVIINLILLIIVGKWGVDNATN